MKSVRKAAGHSLEDEISNLTIWNEATNLQYKGEDLSPETKLARTACMNEFTRSSWISYALKQWDVNIRRLKRRWEDDFEVKYTVKSDLCVYFDDDDDNDGSAS